MEMFKIKKKDPTKRRTISEESLFFCFTSIVTAFLLGVTKIGRISTIFFIVLMYFYFKLLRFIWQLFYKFLKHFVFHAVAEDKTNEA